MVIYTQKKLIIGNKMFMVFAFSKDMIAGYLDYIPIIGKTTTKSILGCQLQTIKQQEGVGLTCFYKEGKNDQ